jgi:mannosyl-oligosaccharide alpha-1,3-glucosidase
VCSFVVFYAIQTVGALWLNTAETFIDIRDGADRAGLLSSGVPRKDTHWISESGIIDVFLFPGPSPSAFFNQYTALTGRQLLPPQFAAAYHQCRWNYKSQDDVASVDAGFDEHDIPYDVLWLDIEHTDGKKYFTWDHALFSQPKVMQQKLADKGRYVRTSYCHAHKARASPEQY